VLKRNSSQTKAPRSSNLELYRIVCMLMIVAHHYVVNSGLHSEYGPVLSNPGSANSLYLMFLGAWGKTGINCFLMITGYFMCKSQITVRKFVKLICQVLFYNIVIYVVFLLAGQETLSIRRIVSVVIPFWGIGNEFVSCYLIFYLTIPFWNILISNLTERQHGLLLALLLTCYTILGSIPTFDLSFNYITWFGVIYLISSYIRIYPHQLFERKNLWGWVTLGSVAIAYLSMVTMSRLSLTDYFFVADSNKFFAVLTAVSSFLWFKNLNIGYSKAINALGAGSFGVLLIHANSEAMITWLWRDVVNCVGHYSIPLLELIGFSVGVILVVFIVCNLIDQLRIRLLEEPLLGWYDRKWSYRLENLFKTE